MKDAYIKADENRIEMKGKGKDLLALFSAIVSSLKFDCNCPEKELKIAVDFGLKHNAANMEEDEDYKKYIENKETENKEKKDEIRKKLEKLMSLLD